MEQRKLFYFTRYFQDFLKKETIVFMILIFPLHLIYSILSISTVQQSDPVTHTTHTNTHTYIYTYFSYIILHHFPSQVTRYSSLCYTAGCHFLSTPNAVVCIYYPKLPVHPTSPNLGNHKSVLQVHGFLFNGKVCCAIS